MLSNPVVKGALSGLLAAALVDVQAFLAWKSLDQAKSYAWSTAIFRWIQGAAAGALSAAGLGLVS
jgi:hypothetical protein